MVRQVTSQLRHGAPNACEMQAKRDRAVACSCLVQPVAVDDHPDLPEPMALADIPQFHDAPHCSFYVFFAFFVVKTLGHKEHKDRKESSREPKPHFAGCALAELRCSVTRRR